MTLYRLGSDTPTLAPGAWVAPSAQLVGKVHLGKEASVWFGVIARGDNEALTIGDGSNVQDGSVMHSDMGFPLNIGPMVTVGHQCVLHGCTIEEGSLIGMGSTILNGAHIGKNCLVGAGSLVTEGKVFPDGSMIMGSPAKVVKALTPEQIAGLQKAALGYIENAKRFAQSLEALPGDAPGASAALGSKP
jgi:carbonic anhydrase/acetyltransferase-like protein (isoleucine patch superfamily)